MRISVWLYHKPCTEMGFEGRSINLKDVNTIRERGQELARELEEKSALLTILLKNGWEAEGALYDVQLHPPTHITTQDEARAEMKRLGIYLDSVCFWQEA